MRSDLGYDLLIDTSTCIHDQKNNNRRLSNYDSSNFDQRIFLTYSTSQFISIASLYTERILNNS